MKTTNTFLMFSGKAEEAMNFYTSLFENSEITSLKKFGANEPGKEGTVKRATFVLNGTHYMCFDSPANHSFSFNPAISIFVNCDNEKELDELFAGLSEHGKILMPLAPYPFSKKYAWLEDKFGVAWQLNLK